MHDECTGVQAEHSSKMMVSSKTQALEVSDWAPYGEPGEQELTSLLLHSPKPLLLCKSSHVL